MKYRLINSYIYNLKVYINLKKISAILEITEALLICDQIQNLALYQI